MDITTTEFGRRPLLAMPHRGPYPEIGSVWGAMFELACANGWMSEDTLCLACYLDDPAEVPAEDLRSYACISVPEGTTPTEGTEMREVGGGTYAVARYIGDYSGLPDAWGEALSTIHASYQVRDGDEFEVYVSHDEENPSASITDIYIPIEQ